MSGRFKFKTGNPVLFRWYHRVPKDWQRLVYNTIYGNWLCYKIVKYKVKGR